MRLSALVRVGSLGLVLGAMTLARDASPQAPIAATPQNVADPGLQAAVNSLAMSIKDASVGVAIVDVASGRLLASYKEHDPLNPASNAKLYTAAAALSILHGDHRYETTISGSLKGGAAGSLTLRGYGDPSLRSDDLASMAQDLHDQGMRRVDGDVFVEQSFYDDVTTPPAFDQKPTEWAAFRAPVSAVAVDENTVTLSVRPTVTGESAHAWFDPPGFVDSEGTITTGDDGADKIVLMLAPNGRRLTAKISGGVGSNARIARQTARVDDPQLLAGYVLKAQLERVGIKVSGDPKLGSAKGAVLARHASAPLSTLLYSLGKQSDNFYAEMIFKSLAGEAKGKPAKTLDSADLVQKLLAEASATDTGVVIKNGSGLYDANRVTAWSTVQLLRWAYRSPQIEPEYVAQLAIGGVDGTLHKRFRSVRDRRAIRAKTGTLDDTIALSGYVIAPAGKPTIAFSIFFNKVAGKASGARVQADKLVTAIVKYVYGD